MNSISYKKIERRNFIFKMFRVMRLYLLFIALGLTQVFASVSYSQSVSMSLRMKNVSIEEVLNQIEKKTDFCFLYNKDVVDVNQKVNVVAEQKSVIEILDNLFKGSEISYTVSGHQIVLNKRGAFGIAQSSKKYFRDCYRYLWEPHSGSKCD